MNLAHLAYVSDATRPLSEAALQALVDRSKTKNRDIQVTGAMLYGNGHFMQLLEGDLHAVNKLYGVIRKDRRHHRVEMLSFCPIRQRRFGDWDMNLLNLESSPKLQRLKLSQIVSEHASQRLDQIEDFRNHTHQLLDEFQAQLLDTRSAKGAA